MGLQELVARINQSGAQGALVISIWRGNPGELTFISPTGSEMLKLRLDTVLLRREVNANGSARIGRAEFVAVPTMSSERVKILATDIATLLNINIQEHQSATELVGANDQSCIWFEDTPSGKLLWTHYDINNQIEIGPRIRISTVWRKFGNESE